LDFSTKDGEARGALSNAQGWQPWVSSSSRQVLLLRVPLVYLPYEGMLRLLERLADLNITFVDDLAFLNNWEFFSKGT
jgi:hypothetical protein